jgi:hypothetical protein
MKTAQLGDSGMIAKGSSPIEVLSIAKTVNLAQEAFPNFKKHFKAYKNGS